MSDNLPVNTPAESIAISPEALQVANAYLQTPDIAKIAEDLEIPKETVSDILDRREVRSYINNVFFSLGFNNRFQMRDLMDTIIKKKLQELDESDTGSTKDIIEILALSHKMTMDALDKELQLEKIRSANQLKNQVNVQINDNAGGSKYSSLIEQLIKGTVNA